MARHSTSHINMVHVQWFVHGAVQLYCDQTGAVAPDAFKRRKELSVETFGLVVLALEGGAGAIGAAYSDMQANLALEALALFQPSELG